MIPGPGYYATNNVSKEGCKHTPEEHILFIQLNNSLNNMQMYFAHTEREELLKTMPKEEEVYKIIQWEVDPDNPNLFTLFISEASYRI